MAKFAKRFGTGKSGTSLLVLFLPSVDRDSRPINQDRWVTKTLEFLGKTFGGATAFPKARGVWRDDERGGQLVLDEPVVVQCYTSLRSIERHVDELREFLELMGRVNPAGRRRARDRSGIP
jgi:hypothetical protein